MYSDRIDIEEFLGLLSSDAEWSYLADDNQMKKVLNLFDKVYGYAKTMSRMKQLQMMHQKRIQNARTKVDTEKPVERTSKFENKILNELYDTNVYTSRAMIERYTDYLFIVLKSRWDPHTRKKYQIWQKTEKGYINQGLDFYQRMQIDQVIREKKLKAMQEGFKEPNKQEESVSDDEAALTTKEMQEK